MQFPFINKILGNFSAQNHVKFCETQKNCNHPCSGSGSGGESRAAIEKAKRQKMAEKVVQRQTAPLFAGQQEFYESCGDG
jgi:hypothetical protein